MHLSELPDVRSHRDPGGATIADDDLEMTNAQFADAVRRVAAAMRARGIGAGDVVAVKLPNTTGLVVTLFAAWRLGAAVTPINPSLVDAEVDYQVGDAAAKILVGDSGIDVAELTSYPEVDEVPPHTCEDALALLIYTSGTTGRPKGVMLDHANLDAMCAKVIEAFRLGSRDHSLLILPLFHVNGIVIGTLAPLLAGGRATIAGRFSPATFFDRLESSGATYFSAVPTIYTMLADLPADVTPDTSAVRFGICGAAPASVQLLERFENRYGFPLIEGYGLSEGTCASTVNPLDGRRKAGTVGLPLPGQTIRIADDTGAPVAGGEAGEVLIKSPTVMRGYLNRPRRRREQSWTGGCTPAISVASTRTATSCSSIGPRT